MPPRSKEDLAYHAAQQRKYRRRDKEARERALAQFAAAAAELLKADYTPGQLLDLILAVNPKEEG